ncbi:MAG: hypothetical protein MUF18_07375 [Fimbriiglobus sp.]|nr:hypothetical protein [Fimbriiglobus sp.]
MTDFVLKAFEALRPDLDGIFTAAAGQTLGGWKGKQQALVTASGAGAAAVPGLHLAGMAADVLFLMNRMSVCSYGIGAILGTEARLGNVLEPEDFAAVLAVWANADGAKELLAGRSAMSGGKVLGQSVYRILAKTVCDKAGWLIEGKLSGPLTRAVAARFAGKLGGKAATGFLPVVGPFVGGGVNLWFLSGVATAAETWFRFKVSA